MMIDFWGCRWGPTIVAVLVSLGMDISEYQALLISWKLLLFSNFSLVLSAFPKPLTTTKINKHMIFYLFLNILATQTMWLDHLTGARGHVGSCQGWGETNTFSSLGEPWFARRDKAFPKRQAAAAVSALLEPEGLARSSDSTWEMVASGEASWRRLRWRENFQAESRARFKMQNWEVAQSTHSGKGD